MYTIFAPYSPSYFLSPPPIPSHQYQALSQDLFFPPVLQFCIRTEEEEKMTFLKSKICTFLDLRIIYT
jgi:hypothetical protein